MNDVRNKRVAPTVDETAFNCPHCGALAKQFWHQCHTEPVKHEHKPYLLGPGAKDHMNLDRIEDPEKRASAEHWVERMVTGRPFLDPTAIHVDYGLNNVHVSCCYNCDDIAIWIYDRLVWPAQGTAPLPNADLPDDVRADYEEASTILDLSPRGAAALLRLGIQKLCSHLGEPGKSVNDDIASLVKKGLDQRVQQALDVVRVVGNNAVHPGQIDLRDDRAIAEKLFGLVNLVAEIMITQPRHVADMYASLPAGARKAIEQRDGDN